MKKAQSSNEEQLIAEELWLNYFNRYLFERGVISQKEYTAMIGKIIRYTAARAKSNRHHSAQYQRNYLL